MFIASCSSSNVDAGPVLIATGPPHLVTSRYVRRHLVRPGDRLRLPCPVRANPPALVTWYKDAGTIHLGWDRYRVRADDWTLSVRDVQLDDTGIFTCRATNGFGSIDITYLVFVSREPPPHTAPALSVFSSVSAKRTSARDRHVLACNFARYSPIFKTFSLADSAINLSEFGY